MATDSTVRTFQTSAGSYTILKRRDGAITEYHIKGTQAEPELIFYPRGRAYVIKNAGGQIGGTISRVTGWDTTVRATCSLVERIAPVGDRLGAIEASARLFLPS